VKKVLRKISGLKKNEMSCERRTSQNEKICNFLGRETKEDEQSLYLEYRKIRNKILLRTFLGQRASLRSRRRCADRIKTNIWQLWVKRGDGYT
jgi:hypothetical protein